LVLHPAKTSMVNPKKRESFFITLVLYSFIKIVPQIKCFLITPFFCVSIPEAYSEFESVIGFIEIRIGCNQEST